MLDTQKTNRRESNSCSLDKGNFQVMEFTSPLSPEIVECTQVVDNIQWIYAKVDVALL